MPSLSFPSSGRAIVQWREGLHTRTLSLGRIPQAAAQEIFFHVRQILTHRAAGLSLPMHTAQWLGRIEDKLYAKLEAKGLAASRAPKATTLGTMLDSFIARRHDLKRNTHENLKQTRDALVNYFGAERQLTDISKAEAKDWRRNLRDTLAEATTATHVKKARQFFADAVDRRMLSENPFAGLKAGSQVNPKRLYYVSRKEIAAVIAECPSLEWQALFSMARFAGLRIPSEIEGMVWSDVNFHSNRIIVRSPKTEHHQGRETRLIPIFPELVKVLADLQLMQPDGTVYMFYKLRGQQLRTQAHRIIERAGLTPWPRVFQNLRSSCETDLTARFPLHVVCAWIGNTAPVAVRHYLQVTDEHFQQASSASAVGWRSDNQGEGELVGVGAQETQEQGLRIPPRGGDHLTEIKGNLEQAEKALSKRVQAYHVGAAAFRARSIRRLAKLTQAARGRN